MTTLTDTTSPPVGPRAVFGRVLVGIDGSHAGREAARQAAVLAEGELTLLTAYDVAGPLTAGPGTQPPPYLDETLQHEIAEHAVERALVELAAGSARGKIARGRAAEELIREVEREHDTLVVVGSHGNGRARGIVMGSTATEVIHQAPCSVLVARDAGRDSPRSIVVGVDGSPESAAALLAARRLAERFGATLWPVVARGGKGVRADLAELIAGNHREDSPDEPVMALGAAAADADLLVVGSRGLHGLASLGSVSEQVAHRARSSVLIVRKPAWQRACDELAH